MNPIRFASVLLVMLCAVSLSACANTVRGVGKDVKGTVKAIADTVE